MTVFIFGHPGSLGGACTELWHTLKLWRQHGVDVCVVETWRGDSQWRKRYESLGVSSTHVRDVKAVRDISGIRGSIVVGFCSNEFLRTIGVLRQLGCSLLWVNCMTKLFSREEMAFRRFGPCDAYVFQSDYQKSELFSPLARNGVAESQCLRIAGAFDIDEFPFRPRTRTNREFVVGRMARASLDKWSENTWSVYEKISFPGRRARVMGWSESVGAKTGAPPAWAETLPPCTESSQEFLSSLHCFVPVSGGLRENWPRVGLEAMASGVPLVVENAGGWREMIEHGYSGMLADNDEAFSAMADELAYDEPSRQQLIHQARIAVAELAKPEPIWQAWKAVFDQLTCTNRERSRV